MPRRCRFSENERGSKLQNAFDARGHLLIVQLASLKWNLESVSACFAETHAVTIAAAAGS
jgi:hypothetical protein